jgi:hypothetical protein
VEILLQRSERSHRNIEGRGVRSNDDAQVQASDNVVLIPAYEQILVGAALVSILQSSDAKKAPIVVFHQPSDHGRGGICNNPGCDGVLRMRGSVPKARQF